MNKAFFLDRDGTINVDKNHLYKIADFEFLPNAPQAISKINKAGYLVIVVTNQAGIGRGYYTEEDVIKLHRHIDQELIAYNAHIDAYYYCPHHPIYGIGAYKKVCECRKPNSGLLKQAVEHFNIDCSKSYIIGDKPWDIEAGENIGISGYMIGEKSLYDIVSELIEINGS